MRDLADHLLDIAENSLMAGASAVLIAIEEETAADRLTLNVQDDGRGMDAETVRRVIDPFYTTRTTRKVGLGLPLLAQNARACGGDLEIDSVPGEGTSVTAWFQRSHIDRQPMGDLVSALSALIVGSPDVEIGYRHVVDDREFSYTTSQLVDETGGLPPSHPEAIRRLRDRLAEGEAFVSAATAS